MWICIQKKKINKKIELDSNIINNQIHSDNSSTSSVHLNYNNQINSENNLSLSAFQNKKKHF
jgi:hypothetical protein